MTLAVVFAFGANAWADPGPRCLNFSAATGTACSPGTSSAEIEAGVVYHRASACPDRTLSGDGEFHCLEAKRRDRRFGDIFTNPETVVVDPDGSATAANLMSNLDTNFGDASATRFELNVVGHAGQRRRPPNGVDLAINAFQPNEEDPSSFTARDILGKVGRNRASIGDRPFAMTLDTCFAGTGVNEFARYVATTENPANVCALGASGEDEFSAEVGSSLARLRSGLRAELDCEPALSEVHRRAMRTDSMPSVPTLTSNALLGQYQRAKANAAPDAEMVAVGAIRDGIATLPCSGESLAPAPPAFSGLGGIIDAVNERITYGSIRARLEQMQGDSLYLLREAGIRGCGTIAPDGSNLDAAKIACYSGKLETGYRTAVERMAVARDASMPRADAIKARYDRRENYIRNLFDEFLGLPHPDRSVSSLGSGGRTAIERAFNRAKTAILARRRTRATTNGTEFLARGNLITRDESLRGSCGREFDTIQTCITNTPAGTPSHAACSSVRDTEIATRIAGAGCDAMSPNRTNPSQPSPREACETTARATAETEVTACQPDCQERYLDEYSPCRLALESIYTQFRDEMASFMRSEHATEAAAVNAVYGEEMSVARDTRKIRRAAEQLEALSGLRTLAADQSETGRKFQGLYLNTLFCEGFDPNSPSASCMRPN